MPKVKATKFLIEKDPSSAINSASVDVEDYLSVPNTNIQFWLPDTEKVDDGNRAGVNAARHQCNTYWNQDDIQIADEVEFIVLPRLLRRLMGGSPTRSVVATGVSDYTWGVLPSQVGNILPAAGLAATLDPANFLYHGVTWDKFNLSQKGAERAQHQTTGFGTGFHTLDPWDPEDEPDNVIPDCTDGRKTVVKYVDNVTTINLSSLGGLEEWTLGHDNFLQKNRRRSGDPGLAVEGVEAGYVRSIPRGNEQQPYSTTLQFIPLFENLNDWKRSVKNNSQLTNFSILIPGKKIATVSSVDYYNELEIIIPKFGFKSITTGNAGGDATSPIAVIPFEDPTTLGTFKVRLRTLETEFEGV